MMTMPGMPAMQGTASALGPERREPVVVGGQVVGSAALRFPAGHLVPAERELRDALGLARALGGLAASVIALGFAVVVARRIMRPIAALAAATEALRRGERSARVDDRPDDEIGDLARGFKATADAMEREDALRRQLLGDVAHELRTPLSTIQGHLEALRDGVLPAEPATFASLHDEASRLGRLVADLESLAHAEGAGFSLEHAPRDLAALARDVGAEIGRRFTEKASRSTSRSGAPASSVTRTVSRRSRATLLSNALKYTPAGGHVRVRTAREEGCAILAVADDGPGIAGDDLPRVFDRFWRGARAVGVSGSGIGLTVARELTRAHGGDITVRGDLGRGSTFTLRLPLTHQPGMSGHR